MSTTLEPSRSSESIHSVETYNSIDDHFELFDLHDQPFTETLWDYMNEAPQNIHCLLKELSILERQ